MANAYESLASAVDFAPVVTGVLSIAFSLLVVTGICFLFMKVYEIFDGPSFRHASNTLQARENASEHTPEERREHFRNLERRKDY